MWEGLVGAACVSNRASDAAGRPNHTIARYCRTKGRGLPATRERFGADQARTCASDRDGRCIGRRARRWARRSRHCRCRCCAQRLGTVLNGHICAGDCARPCQTSPKPGPRGKAHLHQDRARPCHICNRTGLDRGLICACLRREWAHPGHNCKRDWGCVASAEHAVLRRRYTRRHGRVDRPREGLCAGLRTQAAHCEHLGMRMRMD